MDSALNINKVTDILSKLTVENSDKTLAQMNYHFSVQKQYRDTLVRDYAFRNGSKIIGLQITGRRVIALDYKTFDGIEAKHFYASILSEGFKIDKSTVTNNFKGIKFIGNNYYIVYGEFQNNIHHVYKYIFDVFKK